MKQMTTFDSNYEFIELNRTFHEISKSDNENDNVDISQAFYFGDHLSWPDLVKEYRLIILSEAGSGKTYEIHNIASMLRNQGKPAFFLRLEHIPRDFEDAFEVGTYEEFEIWLASGEEGWLLLDSVDEARLRNPGDFELAIQKLSRRIKTAKDRTHITITSRITAWRPKTDLAYCTDHLPYAMATTSESDPQTEDNGPRDTVLTKTKKRGEVQSTFKIVALNDLTSHQIAIFAKARGIDDSNAFLDAVERADAKSFTSRPQDLDELTRFWIDKSRIGTRLEIMQNSIARRLAERDQGRAEARPLSAEHARQGSRILAAATTLTRDPTIRVPDGAEYSKGIAIQFVLPDWDDKDQSTLLSRPIFDEAIYGAVRFHHRSVREYLTAEWFSELLKRETSRRKIETLFFHNQYGLDIVVPTLRPILPWLVILDEKIRERVHKVAPEVILEGGDPNQLPLDVRRSILHEVCERMENGGTGNSIQDYAAVQRFANPDLSEEVIALIQKYANNEDLTAYLLRMVWLGQIKGALPEAMNVALKSTASEYTRIAAFMAIKAIGSKENQNHIRQSFLAEALELKRKWLAELLDCVQPTEQNLVWLLACLEKSEPKEPYSVDYLSERVTEFVEATDIELLPQLITGLNRLLSLPPMIEHYYCEVSEKFQWLLTSGCKAVERLILIHHPASLEPDALAILHKFSFLQRYNNNELIDVKTRLSKLIPTWKNLNQALFWFEVQKSREAIAKKNGERLTNFWQSSISESLWRFKEDDFGNVTEQISHKASLDDKLVALSLAFNLYKEANRPPKWRLQMKKLVAKNNELSTCLGAYLRPPAQNRNSRRWKQQEAKWKKQNEASQRKKEKYHTEWKKYLNDNLEKLQTALCEKPGTITNALLYLFDLTRDKKNATSRWTEYNWKTLIPEYGEEVARFYRDSTVSFWRHHEPKLRSEGAPDNETSYSAIIGLVGLEIEAIETKDWQKNLKPADVTRACRYASFELNGFPTWFPKLFEAHSEIVCNFLMREIRYELSIEKPDKETHYTISNLSWSGQWAWDQIAPSIYELLNKREPKNLSNLEKLLKIIQGSTLPDGQIKELATRKCRTLKKLNHIAHWFAVWIGVAPEDAIASFKARIGKITTRKKQTSFAMTFVTHLLGDHRNEGAAVRQAFKTPNYLRSLYLLMHKHIRVKEDIDRAGKGVYSPGLRDQAQNARNSLLDLLNQIPGKESFLALLDIAKVHPEEAFRPWILLRAKTKAEHDGDIEPWSPCQVRDFFEKQECTPNNHRELAELAVLRLQDLKDDLENGDSSIAGILKTVTQETDMRKYIGHELREKAFGRYSIPQEEELADAKKPDMRFHGVGFDGPVPIELKLADKWTGPELFKSLEIQLCGDYLRDNRSRRGIFVLVNRGKKKGWDIPFRDNRVDFAGLTAVLKDYWQQISPKFLNIDDITVIGIDLTKRVS